MYVCICIYISYIYIYTVYIYIYIYGFVATHVLGHMVYGYVIAVKSKSISFPLSM